MSDIRIWHASRDAYHCAFRILRLLSIETQQVERLRILDMYLMFPSLLHRTSMTKDLKDKFRELKLEKPEQKFIRLPSNAAVFQELRIYQNSALSQLAARGLVASAALKKGLAKVDKSAIPKVLLSKIEVKNSSEHSLIEFLLGPFSVLPLRGRESLYRRAGLPTRSIAE